MRIRPKEVESFTVMEDGDKILHKTYELPGYGLQPYDVVIGDSKIGIFDGVDITSNEKGKTFHLKIKVENQLNGSHLDLRCRVKPNSNILYTDSEEEAN